MRAGRHFIICSLSGTDGILFLSPVSIPVTLAHVCRRGWIALSSKCVTLPCDAAWAWGWLVSRDLDGSLVIDFICPGYELGGVLPGYWLKLESSKPLRSCQSFQIQTLICSSGAITEQENNCSLRVFEYFEGLLYKTYKGCQVSIEMMNQLLRLRPKFTSLCCPRLSLTMIRSFMTGKIMMKKSHDKT